MKGSTLICSAFIMTGLALPALAQPFEACSVSGGVTELNFNSKPSLVVHSDAVMDTTFDQAGIGGGDPDEKLFSFNQTIGAILDSAGAPNTATSREAFVQTMLDSMQPVDSFALNRDAGMLVPFDGRPGESIGLTAAGMLDPDSDIALKPLAVFNRFDLAPDDWSHCGEHRIVYGKINPDIPAPANRALFIFEAAVPNPGVGENGCRPITEFWANLSDPDAGDDVEIAAKLHAFFYEGKTDPALTRADLVGPVVDFRNYGGDGSRGQVRGNLFMTSFVWQLREWLTQLTFDPAQPIAFVTETVKDNPIAELYRDDLAGQPIHMANIEAAVTTLQGDFVQALSTSINRNLTPENAMNYRDLLNDLGAFDLGAESVSEQEILLNTIALGNDNSFNEHQSTSFTNIGPSDDIRVQSPPGSKLRTVLDQLSAASTPGLNPQTAEVFLNRAQAATCAGCHELSPGDAVRVDSSGAVLFTWPAVAAGGFVHVRELDRALSPALENAFLPFRRYVMGRHLCSESEEIGVASSSSVPADGTSDDGMRYVDRIIAGFQSSDDGATEVAASSSTASSADGGAMLMSMTEALQPEDREAVREAIRAEIAEARERERQRAGAFVRTRRPH